MISSEKSVAWLSAGYAGESLTRTFFIIHYIVVKPIICINDMIVFSASNQPSILLKIVYLLPGSDVLG